MPKRVQHHLALLKNISVPEPANAKALRTQPRIALFIMGTLIVLTAVGFEDQFVRKTDKIDDVSANRNLPSEFEVIEASAAEELPKFRFSLCLRLAKSARLLTDAI